MSRTPRWLLVGAGGMLGHDLLELLQAHDSSVQALPRAELDITDPATVHQAVEKSLGAGDVLVNCAAYTAVDAAEDDEATAFTVNAAGPALLAAACARVGARMVQISTDYVFSGQAPLGADGSPVGLAVDAPMVPVSAYGRTKAAGEWAVRAHLPDQHLILRTAWLYGRHGGNFVATMARLEGERDFVDVVTDQVGQPTWTMDLAERIVAAVQAQIPAGTYHACAAGQTSWHGLAQEVFRLRGADPARVRETTSAQFVRPAPRPAWSVLDLSDWSRVGLAPMRSWDEALRAAIGVIL